MNESPVPTRLLTVDARSSPPIATVCAWCPDSGELHATLRRANWKVSHGMCPACAREWSEATEEPMPVVAEVVG